MIVNDPKKNDEMIKSLTNESKRMTEQSPRLASLQKEIDRLLANTPGQSGRKEAINIMFHSAQNELMTTLNHINELIDSISRKLEALQSTEIVNTTTGPAPDSTGISFETTGQG